MQNIGDRLAEARKRLGVALREASEATKIRTDYLQAMENGTFDFSLPAVYKRGFLKIYARYLKLDADKLAADFATQFSGGVVVERENLGRVDAPGAFSPAAIARASDTAGDYDGGRAQNQAAIIRLVAFVGVAVVVIILLIVGFNSLRESSTGSDNGAKTAAVTPPPAPVTPAPPPAPVTPTYNFVFNAVGGDITNLTVWQEPDLKKISEGPLKKGKSLSLPGIKGQVSVGVSQAQFLTIQVNGGVAQGLGDGKKRITGPIPRFLWPPVAQQGP